MEPIITTEFHFTKLDTVSVKVEYYVPTRVPNPTERELASVPARFRCIVCGKQKGKKHFGGLIAGERVCRICYPFTDESDVQISIQKREFRPATKRDNRHPPFVKDVWQGIKPEMVAEGYDETTIIVD